MDRVRYSEHIQWNVSAHIDGHIIAWQLKVDRKDESEVDEEQKRRQNVKEIDECHTDAQAQYVSHYDLESCYDKQNYQRQIHCVHQHQPCLSRRITTAIVLSCRIVAARTFKHGIAFNRAMLQNYWLQIHVTCLEEKMENQIYYLLFIIYKRE